MAGQQQQILDTIFNMKRRLLRKDDSSDSEETDSPYGNHMQSLKRKAQYARAGHPASASDPPPYKKRIEHAGYHRLILQRNPLRYDPDGDIVEPGDEYEDEDDLSVVEENPYADIKLEELLAPLTSAADLPNHKSYSLVYTSKHLTNLASEAGAISRKEQISLWRSKALLTKLIGDPTFIPNGLGDMDGGVTLQRAWANATGDESIPTTNGHIGQLEDGSEAQDALMTDSQQPNGASKTAESNENMDEDAAVAQNGIEGPTTNGDAHKEQPDGPQENDDGPDSPLVDGASDTTSQQAAHRMTTRARAQANSDPTPPSSPGSAMNLVHPLYTFPLDSIPDRDFGLPGPEAEDTRLLLLAFVQKQEEISRAATDLYMGMMQGERMRQDVFKWSKAEAHVGEMSDGEDWYDREEWSLEQDLTKGRDEEEDETAAAGKKSTRQRRKPDKEDR